jgi:hypothetical protein
MSESISLASDCGQLRVRFLAGDDRFCHVIERLVGESFQPLLRSVEETADSDWPSSSPLQEVRLSGTNHGDCVLGTGMAGRSFWSLSVTPSGSGLAFDHACRYASGVVPRVMTTYEASQDFVVKNGNAIQSISGGTPLAVTPLPTSSGRPPAIEIIERRMRIEPAQRQGKSDADRTLRWAFRFHMDRDGGRA